ncbi:MAG: AmmeMemoRadiSam system protein A [Synergistaceae bacterium]|jgi:AmmeMemoRadiSam system protein A|nr:AmmeMemoRadiSam system protein A [Synergistaceae bacterium]
MTDVEKNHPYVVLARRTAERYLSGGVLPANGLEVDPRAELWSVSRACFVSIKTLSGDLRGCIGTILPTCPSLDAEIIENAISASVRDPRFPPMKKNELDRVVFSVDVLSAPEKIPDRSMLDVKKWGVIVSKGARRGVLLPDLDGVDTVDEQIEIASRKAGIYDADGVTLERFSVRRYPEI